MDSRYLTPGVMTELGKAAENVARLPGNFPAIAAALQSVCIHEFLGDMYGVTFSDDDRETVHLRRASDVLDVVLSRDPQPFEVARAPSQRVATNCRGFSVLAVAMLRAHGVPARARCGFGTYFTPGHFEDHWVVEYFDSGFDGGRWKRGDAQIDAVQAKAFGIDFDLADLPPGKFLTGGEAWQMYRRGEASPSAFGLSSIEEGGDWWIAGNLMRDVAALDNVETLPWDCWDPMPSPSSPVDAGFFDRMAAGSEPVSVPSSVYSAVRKRAEPLL